MGRAGLQRNYEGNYILNAVSPGSSWDKDRDVLTTALYGAGLYLRDHRDAELRV